MKLIGAGFGRTGTLSLKQALEELGLGPCYHMQQVLEKRGHAQAWQAIVDGKSTDFEAILGTYQSGVDSPVCMYYKELMAIYPDAKVLLSVRDPDRWFESVYTTIYQISLLPRWMERVPRLGPFLHLTRTMRWEGLSEGRFADRAFSIAQFNDHNAEVQRVVPADKLLVFSVKEGWEPLCEFLGVPVPDRPFPHVNDRKEMLRNINVMRWFGRLVPAAFISFIGLIIWRISRENSRI